MSGFWLISFIVLWIVVIGLSLVILAMSKEIEELHVRLDSVIHFLGSSDFGAKEKSNLPVMSATEGKHM